MLARALLQLVLRQVFNGAGAGRHVLDDHAESRQISHGMVEVYSDDQALGQKVGLDRKGWKVFAAVRGVWMRRQDPLDQFERGHTRRLQRGVGLDAFQADYALDHGFERSGSLERGCDFHTTFLLGRCVGCWSYDACQNGEMSDCALGRGGQAVGDGEKVRVVAWVTESESDIYAWYGLVYGGEWYDVYDGKRICCHCEEWSPVKYVNLEELCFCVQIRYPERRQASGQVAAVRTLVYDSVDKVVCVLEV